MLVHRGANPARTVGVHCFMRRLLAFAVLLLTAHAAAAEIRIRESRFADGRLIVRGQTAPDREVTLQGRFSTTADKQGRFSFSVPYDPVDCFAELRSGPDRYYAVIAGCFTARHH